MNNIARLRKEKGLSQSELARISGIGRDTIIRIEKGGNTTLRTLDNLQTAIRKAIPKPCPHCGR